MPIERQPNMNENDWFRKWRSESYTLKFISSLALNERRWSSFFFFPYNTQCGSGYAVIRKCNTNFNQKLHLIYTKGEFIDRFSLLNMKLETKKKKRKKYEETLISNTLHSSIIRCISKKKWNWFYSNFLISLNSISVLISMKSFFFLLFLSIHLLLSIPFYLCLTFFFHSSMELFSFSPWRHCCMHIA